MVKILECSAVWDYRYTRPSLKPWACALVSPNCGALTLAFAALSSCHPDALVPPPCPQLASLYTLAPPHHVQSPLYSIHTRGRPPREPLEPTTVPVACSCDLGGGITWPTFRDQQACVSVIKIFLSIYNQGNLRASRNVNSVIRRLNWWAHDVVCMLLGSRVNGGKYNP